MKKQLLIISAFLIGTFSANAQITITSSDVATPIKVIYQSNDTLLTSAGEWLSVLRVDNPGGVVEASLALRGIWPRGQEGVGEALLKAFVGTKVEQLVLHDRPANRAAILVPGEVGFPQVIQIVEPAARGHRRIAVVVPARAVYFVRTGLDRHVYNTTRAAPKFSREAVRLHFELGNRIGTRLHHLRAQGLRVLRSLIVVDANEQKLVLRMIVAVRDELARPTRHRI